MYQVFTGLEKIKNGVNNSQTFVVTSHLNITQNQGLRNPIIQVFFFSFSVLFKIHKDLKSKYNKYIIEWLILKI